MEITIVIGMGESLQDVLRRTKLNPVGPMTLTLTSENQNSIVPSYNVEPAKSGAWTQKESIWMANQPRPTGVLSAKIGRTKVPAIDAAFAEKFGYRRTYKSLMSKWNRMNKK